MVEEVLIVLVVVVVLAVPTIAAIVHCGKRQPKILPVVPPTDQKELQTDPIFFSELECAVQCPLDVVFLVDSSASVGESGFRSCISFLHAIVSELEMPPVNAGLVRFHHDLKVISDLTGVKDAFLHSITNMAFDPGETKLAAPLRRGADMLRNTAPDRKKVIVVVTDGDPNDLDKTKDAAKACKADFIDLVFVVTGRAAQMHIVNELASPPTEKNVITLPDHDALAAPHAASRVLQCVVEVAMRVRRAKCSVGLDAFQAQPADLNTIGGFDVMVPGWANKSGVQWSWEPNPQIYLENAKIPWSDELTIHGVAGVGDYAEAVPPLPPVRPEFTDKAVTAEVVFSAPSVPDRRRRTSSMSVPEKLFKVQLGPWQNAPLDLVICLDSSASFFLTRNAPTSAISAVAEAFSQSTAFQHAKGFVCDLAHKACFPGVRLGLIRFHEEEEVICPLTDDVDDFQKKLHEMPPRTRETKFTPALRKAWHLLDTPHAYVDTFGEAIKPSKAVLVITDGDPNDARDAASQVERYRSSNFQLLYLKVGQAGYNDRDCLDDLAVVQPPPGSTTLPEHRGVFRTSCTEDGIVDAAILVPKILSQVLWAIRPVVRAMCIVPMSEDTCEVVNEGIDLSSVPGNELCVPQLTPPLDRKYVLWSPDILPTPDDLEMTKPFPGVHRLIPRMAPSMLPEAEKTKKESHSCANCEAAARARLDLKQQLADAGTQIESLKAQLPMPMPYREGEVGEASTLSAFIRLRNDVEEAQNLKLAAEWKVEEVRRELTSANDQLTSDLAAATAEIEKLRADAESRQRAFERSLEEQSKSKHEVEVLLMERADAADRKASASNQAREKIRAEQEPLLRRVRELEERLLRADHAAQGFSQTVASLTRKNEELVRDLTDKDRVVAENLLLQERVEHLELEIQRLKQENDDLGSTREGTGTFGGNMSMNATWQSDSNMPQSPFGGQGPATILTQDGGGEMLWVHKAELRRCLDEWESALNRADNVEGQMRQLEARIVRVLDSSALVPEPKSNLVTLRQWLDTIPLATPTVIAA